MNDGDKRKLFGTWVAEGRTRTYLPVPVVIACVVLFVAFAIGYGVPFLATVLWKIPCEMWATMLNS